MRMIPPITIDSGNMTTTAVYNTSEWSSGSNYSVGDLVHSLTTERVYEALIASTSGDPKDPATDPLDGSSNPYWLDIAPTNPTAMFDFKNSTQTLATTTLEVVITPNERADSVAIFNISGVSEINVTVTSANAGGTIHNEDYPMNESEGPPMWDRIFGTLVERTSLVADGWLAYSDVVITITFTGADIGVGNVVVGQVFQIGQVAEGLTINPRDYSLMETNDEGETEYLPRNSTFEVSGQVRIESAIVDPFLDRLTKNKVPRAFIVSDQYRSANVFGVNANFPIKLSTAPEAQIANFKIVGLT